MPFHWGESHVRRNLGIGRVDKDHNGKSICEILSWSSEKLYRHIQREMEINPLLRMREDFKREVEEAFPRFPVDMDEWFREDGDGDVGDDVYNEGLKKRSHEYRSTPYDGITLQEHLMSQLKAMDVSPEDERIAAFIIENLDGNGYLPVSKHEIAATLKVDRYRVSRMLRLVQTLDPPGVGARSLKECLLIQLSQMGKVTPLIRTIILEHLKDLVHNRLDIISKKTGIPVEELQRIRDLIRSLESRPGRWFASLQEGRATIPDIIVKRIGKDYHTFVLEHAAPRLRINRTYLNLLQRPHLEKDVSEYIAHKLDSALALIKALEQRRIVLNRVAMAIVSRQKEFLDCGPEHLKPLAVRTVAEDCSMHVCLVRRVVENKYIQTPHGMFELRCFLINF